MERTFFITGLPRSRTAWLANFLTYGQTFCFHEMSRLMPGTNHLAEMFASVKLPIVGTADSAFPFYASDAMRQFPKAAVVVVHRDAVEACHSFEKFIAGHQVVKDAPKLFEFLIRQLENLQSALATRHVLQVKFAQLSEYKVCEAIWSHCTGGEPFHYARWSQLIKLNVQVLPAIAAAEGDSNMKRLGHLFQLSVPTIPAVRNARSALHDEYDQLLAAMCAPAPGAYVWLKSLWEVLLTWDHIEDGDPIDKAMANRAFEALVLLWPQNPFYAAHKDKLLPAMLNAVSAWRHSNAGGPACKGWDFHTEVPCTVAAIIGGMNAVNQYVPRLRDLSERIRAVETEIDL